MSQLDIETLPLDNEAIYTQRPKKFKQLVYLFVVNLVPFAIELSYIQSTLDFFYVNITDESDYKPQIQQLVYYILTGLVAPLIGFIVQFVCGVISDHFQLPLGRRKFFMALGGIIWIIGRIICICSSVYPVKLIWKAVKGTLDSEGYILDQTDGMYITSEVFYGIGYGLYTIGINMIQVSHRTFLLDTFDNQHQNQAWTMSAFNSILARSIFFTFNVIVHGSLRSTTGLDYGNRSVVNCIFELIPLIAVPTIIFFFCWKIKEEPYLGDKITLKECGKECYTFFKKSTLNVYCIWLVLFFGWTSVYGFEGEKSNVYYNNLYYGCGDIEASFVHEIQKALSSNIAMILLILLFFFNKRMDVSYVLSLLCCGISSFAFYDMNYFIYDPSGSMSSSSISTNSYGERTYDKCLFGDGMSSYHAKSLIPLIFGMIVYSHVNSYPFALIRSFTETNRFGFSIGIMNGAVILGQTVSSLLYICMYIMSLQAIHADTNDPFMMIFYYMLFIAPAMLVSGVVSMVLNFLNNMDKMNVRPDFEEFEESQLMDDQSLLDV